MSTVAGCLVNHCEFNFEMCKHIWESDISPLAPSHLIAIRITNLRLTSNSAAANGYFSLNSEKCVEESANSCFCPTNSPKPKGSSFTLINDKDKQQLFDIFT